MILRLGRLTVPSRSLLVRRRFSTSRPDSNAPGKEEMVKYLKAKFARFDMPGHYEQLVKKAPEIQKLKRASILVPISVKNSSSTSDEPHTFYTLSKRTEMMNSFKGQVCFVGGKMEPGENELATALREAREEIGIEPTQVTYIAQLCPLITFNRLLVTPVVVYFDKTDFRANLNASEVDFIFELETKRFLSSQGHKTELYKNDNGEYLIHYFKDRVFAENRGAHVFVKTWGFTGFMCAVISAMLHSRVPEFDLISNQDFKLSNDNFNEFIEKFLLNKLLVSAV